MRSMFRQAVIGALVLMLMLPATAAAQLGTPVGGSTRGTLGAGDVLVGWGTSGAASLRTRSITLTNAQVLDLRDTPITVIPATGAGSVVDVIGVVVGFDYAAAYTGGADLRMYYGNYVSGSAASGLIASGCFVSVSADTFCRTGGAPDGTKLSTNTAVVLASTGADFGGGNAANVVRVQILYRVTLVP